MEDRTDLDAPSRRALLQYAAGALGLSWLSVSATAGEAAQYARQAAKGPSAADFSFLAADEAVDVEAVAAEIIPTDATPGAREAGAVYFIDRALASFFAPLSGRFKMELAEFQSAYRTRYADTASFAALPQDVKIAFLHTIAPTPFFNMMRLLTILGTFADPAYGGNHDRIGWKLMGFEDRHAFMPPFGYYDGRTLDRQ
jgi:gluconate 2-dehydrogenase gamma chain